MGLRCQARWRWMDCSIKVYNLYSICALLRFIRMKSTPKKRTPSIVNLTVKRRYLTQREIERLMDCARKHGRYGHRDATNLGGPQAMAVGHQDHAQCPYLVTAD